MEKASSEAAEMVLAGAHLNLRDPRQSEYPRHAKRTPYRSGEKQSER